MDCTESLKPIWGKTSPTQDGLWIPLYVHHHDTCLIITKLWEEWVSESVRGVICGSMACDDEKACKILRFLAASHDIGKCIPAFQTRKLYLNPTFQNEQLKRLEVSGLDYNKNLAEPDAIKHSVATEWILEKNGVHRSLALIGGGHHGKPPGDSIRKVEAYQDNVGARSDKWKAVQYGFLEYALQLSGLTKDEIVSVRVKPPGESLMTGLLIMADWIASNEYLFPMGNSSDYSEAELDKRAVSGWDNFHLLKKWVHKEMPDVGSLFEERFGFSPRPFQSSALSAASAMDRPGIVVIEAPMGEGKTEAALGMAELLTVKFGLSGVFFALPSQATSDGLFPRVVNWIENLSLGKESSKTIFLAHGKADFNRDYNQIHKMSAYQTDDSLVVHEWFRGRKKGILSDFVVGTVDQILMAGLKRKHLSLRHLGLANKVVIIDEVHAYDEYMGSYLEKSLSWLGAYNVPVILLSATLPISRRKKLIEAYLRGKRIRPLDGDWQRDVCYPLITTACSAEIECTCPPSSNRKSEVDIIRLRDENLIERIASSSENGGYVGIIVNTVNRAQRICRELADRFGRESVELLHSRFTAYDRAENEARVMSKLKGGRQNPPFRLFVVGTQVMEQSLDLDFDVLFTDICPMDLLLQRIGRLHRHDNLRPTGLEKPICYVVTDGEGRLGADIVYGKFMNYNTEALLPDRVSLPDDIPILVQRAYGGRLEVPPRIKDDYDEAYRIKELEIQDKEIRAKQFQVCYPNVTDLMHWLDDDLSGEADVEAKATVRDIDSSLEVTLFKIDEQGLLATVSGPKINMDDITIADDTISLIMAGNRISLPHAVISKHKINKVMEELKPNTELLPASIRESSWVNGELFLILDSNGKAQVGDTAVHYDEEYGMVVDRK